MRLLAVLGLMCALAACATTAPPTTPVVVTVSPVAPASGNIKSVADVAPSDTRTSPFLKMADLIDELAQNHLTAHFLQNAQETIAWAQGGSADSPTDPLMQYKAALCPMAVQRAVMDFQSKAAGFSAQLRALDAQVSGAVSGEFNELLLAERLAYGTALGDPKAQLQSIRQDVFQQIDLVLTSCRTILTSPNVQAAMKKMVDVAAKAGLIGATGGAGAIPLMVLKPL
jgi:hypothetical protein